jgi:Uncharacterized conserved protein (DUF2358)
LEGKLDPFSLGGEKLDSIFTGGRDIGQEKMEFLKEDLKHLFDDQGIDPTAYDDAVDFVDPITKYGNARGRLPFRVTTHVMSYGQIGS